MLSLVAVPLRMTKGKCALPGDYTPEAPPHKADGSCGLGRSGLALEDHGRIYTTSFEPDRSHRWLNLIKSGREEDRICTHPEDRGNPR